jgi:Domain of unknown function (DUF4389)
MQPSPAPYPATFTFDPPEKITRWQPLIAWLLVIPHVFVLYFVNAIAGICSVIAWFAILFTGTLPDGLAGPLALVIRYQTRVTTFALFLREEYPPFSFDATAADPGDDPRVRVEITPQLTDRNRVTVFFRYFLVIPHAFALAFVGLAVGFAMLVALVVVLVSGAWPPGVRDLVLGYERWSVRLAAYALLLTDEYPPFSLS